MPAQAPPDSLKRDVKAAIVFVSPKAGLSVDALSDKADLIVDCRLSAPLCRTLASPFQRIARAFKPGATVSAIQCERLDTVRSAITLVAGAAGFTAE
jgi:hypothetical protein